MRLFSHSLTFNLVMKKQLTKAEVVALLKEKQGDRSSASLAAEIGISRSYLSEIFKGTRLPGPVVLDFLQLEAETITIYRKVA